jgi:RNA polymerase sigma factor (sigma-70 family)
MRVFCPMTAFALSLRRDPVPLRGVVLCALMPHRYGVPDRKNSPANDARGLALEALRDPLIGYFRRRVAEQDDVQDLVQEVFLRLSTRGGEDGIENLRGYVFQVAASVLADRGRRRTVRKHDAHIEFDPDRGGGAELGPDRIVAGREALKAVMAAVAQMPDRTRTVFILRRLEGMAYRDIAAQLGVSVSAVEKHMLRATERLARLGEAQ